MGKSVTSKDVAREAGVSQSMVSLVLNNVQGIKIKDETREKVVKAVRKLNYKININAKNMRTHKAMSIGLLSSWNTSSFVFSPIIDGLKSVCEQNNNSITICNGKKLSSGNFDYIDYFYQNRIDGVAYISYVGVPYEGVIKTLKENNIPFICIIGARDIPEVSCVDVNFIQSGYIAAQHLFSQGYKKSAYILPETFEKLTYAEEERLNGFKCAAQEVGLEVMTVGIFDNIRAEEQYIKAASDFIKKHRVDSLVSTSYGCFIFLKAAAQLGVKVPEELGIISLDNDVFASYTYPSLTTIDEPLFDIASKSAKILFDNIDGDNAYEKVEVHPHISVRESTTKESYK